MLLVPLALSALLPLTLASAPPAQLRLYPSPETHSTSPISLSAPQANAVLAHHLGVAQYERLPLTTGDRRWEEALGSSGGWEQGQKVVVLLECGKEGCDDFIPETFADSKAYELPSLPVHSWTAAIILHLHRLATSLGLDPNSPVVVGLDSFVQGLKSLDGWSGWVGEELGARIGWDKIKETVKAAVEPVRQNLGLLTDVDFLDESANTFITEMESLVTLVDAYAASASRSDDGPQGETPQIVAVHIKGMKAICDTHSRTSETYQRAASLLRQTLTATLASLSTGQESQQPTFVLLTLPPHSPPFFRKRAAWLSPFSSGLNRYATTQRTRSVAPPAHAKRSTIFSPSADAGRKARRAASTPQPIVSSSKTCFESEAQLKNLTANCLDRGVGVKGLSTRSGDCWVCSCGKTTEGGKTKSWAGEGCEKEDLSGDFVLLFFSGLGLLLVLFVSVLLLYNVGTSELPGTLSSVSGAGAGSKRD